MRYSCARLGLSVSLLIACSASAVTMDWTPIGDPGNAPDTQPFTQKCGPDFSNQGCGSVGYAYSIGTYEVTNAQYAEFLNAKAKSDLLGLYNDDAFTVIQRTGSPGSYSYQTSPDIENGPVHSVSYFDALRFTNWMANGQGDGDTETGAYTLLGGNATPSNADTVARNLGATIVLTSENEWYKAAYYDPATASYFAYPTSSNTPTTCAAPTAAPNSANCGLVLTPYRSSDVGSYTGSASSYGTYDQGGNVYEWNEEIAVSHRIVRGGAYHDLAQNLHAAARGINIPSAQQSNTGFRLAMIPGGYVPEPSTGLLVIAGLLGLGGWRRATA